jgi:hypothetical protein
VRSGLPSRRRSWTRPCRWCRRGPRSVSWPFYGTADLIAWCQDRNWDDRLRRKGNRVVRNTEGRTTTGPLAKERLFALENVPLIARKATTPIGVIHDPDHAEPWIITMAATPGYLKTLEYSARWAIEPMFSDFKSRGFGVEDTQIQHPDRLARLLLVMALAIYAAVSTGPWDAQTTPTPAEKKMGSISRKKSLVRKSPSSPEDCAGSPD